MKQNIEKTIHLNMAFIGGFFGGFAILNHCEIFGSAQTSNLISLALILAGENSKEFFIRIGVMLLYFAGVSLTVVLPHKIKNINMKFFSLAVTTIATFVLYALPKETNHLIALYPIFFAMAVQWCCFKGADGFTSSCIFSTNNFRQCTASFTQYFLTKDKEALRKGKFFGSVLLFFHVGVMFSCVACRFFGQSGVLACLVPIAISAFFIHEEALQKAHAADKNPMKANQKQPIHMPRNFAH